jgi:hypothetical protein
MDAELMAGAPAGLAPEADQPMPILAPWHVHLVRLGHSGPAWLGNGLWDATYVVGMLGGAWNGAVTTPALNPVGRRVLSHRARHSEPPHPYEPLQLDSTVVVLVRSQSLIWCVCVCVASRWRWPAGGWARSTSGA